MKKISVLAMLSISLLSMKAQTIQKIEYYINNDPGFGAAGSVPITAAADIVDVSVPINIGSLPPGFHTLNFRSLDNAGRWSLTNHFSFVKMANADSLTDAEYFVDTDPGFGKAIALSVTAGSEIAGLVVPIDLTALDPGMHFVGLRSKDNLGRWSLTNFWHFLREQTPATGVTTAEYFIDNDPGFGWATAVNILPGADVGSIAVPVDIGSLSPGMHFIGFRSKDNSGKWSLTNYWHFLSEKSPATLVEKVEYFVDNDPGFGMANPVVLNNNADTMGVIIPVNVSAVDEGFHRLFVRAKDNVGRWSLTNVHVLVKESVAATVVKGEYFFNQDPGFGNGVQLGFAAADSIKDFNFSADVSGIPNGPSWLFVRTQDNLGRWSLTNVWAFDKNTVLPLKGLNFVAQALAHGAMLDWTTVSEQNTSHFDVERSADAIHFEKIAELKAAGNSASQRAYQFNDKNVNGSVAYYRLKQWDKDGHFEYSPVRRVQFNNDLLFALLNNPSNGSPVIAKTNRIGSTISVFDASGKKLFDRTVTQSSTSIEVTQLSNGTYFIVLHNNGKIEATNRFIIQH